MSDSFCIQFKSGRKFKTGHGTPVHHIPSSAPYLPHNHRFLIRHKYYSLVISQNSSNHSERARWSTNMFSDLPVVHQSFPSTAVLDQEVCFTCLITAHVGKEGHKRLIRITNEVRPHNGLESLPAPRWGRDIITPPVFRESLKKRSTIRTKLAIPYPTSILLHLRKLCQNPTINF